MAIKTRAISKTATLLCCVKALIKVLMGNNKDRVYTIHTYGKPAKGTGAISLVIQSRPLGETFSSREIWRITKKTRSLDQQKNILSILNLAVKKLTKEQFRRHTKLVLLLCHSGVL